MKSFFQFIVESEEAADRLDQRRQIARDKSRTAASDFKTKSKDNMSRIKAKHAAMREKSDRDSEIARRKRALQDAQSRERARHLGSAVKQSIKQGARSIINRISR